MEIASERWNIIQAAVATSTSDVDVAVAAADTTETERGKTINGDDETSSTKSTSTPKPTLSYKTKSGGQSRRIYVSFDDGLDPRPLEVYLQNLFAVAQGVEIAYPLADASVQEALLRSDFPKRWVDTRASAVI